MTCFRKLALAFWNTCCSTDTFAASVAPSGTAFVPCFASNDLSVCHMVEGGIVGGLHNLFGISFVDRTGHPRRHCTLAYVVRHLLGNPLHPTLISILWRPILPPELAPPSPQVHQSAAPAYAVQLAPTGQRHCKWTLAPLFFLQLRNYDGPLRGTRAPPGLPAVCVCGGG